jgi:SAM-dependent methyltransferase
MPVPSRRCLECGALESVAANELVWPLGWRCPACGHAVAQDQGITMFAPELADTISGIDPKSFQTLAEIESSHFWFVARNALIVGLITKHFPNARRYLEVGCGNGPVLQAVAASRRWERLVGSELHPSGLAYARERLPREVEFVQMDARKIPASGVFDLIGAFDVIEHIADDWGVLGEMRAAVETGGGTIVAVPQHPWLWSRADEIAHHVRRYCRGELEAKLQRSGFEVVFSSSFTSLLLPLMAASRLKGAKQDEDAYEFKLSSALNKLLLRVLEVEVRMTLTGWSWPVGGSRVVVARAV